MTLKDNYNYLSLYVGDNQEFVQPYKSPVDVLTPANAEYVFVVPAKHGDNKVNLRLIDFAGNTTSKEVSIFRAETKPEPIPTPVVKSGWALEGNTWFYYVNDVKDTGWVLYNSKWYFLNADGAMETGWVSVGGKWYFLNAEGAMQTSWVSDGGKWYFLNADGVMQTGWLKLGIDWYLLSKGGVMETGWVLVSGKWYYLTPVTGKMAYNTTIDGFKLDKNGVWIK